MENIRRPACSAEYIFIDLIYQPVFTLGPGERIGIWTRGCTIRCPGCAADHAWEFLEEYKMKTADAAAKLLKYALAGCRALTISGGEPFDQPEALGAVLSAAREGGIDDILVYSGYCYETLKTRHAEILKKIDALIDSPFVAGAKSVENWRGSSNQNLIMLTSDAKLIKKYADFTSNVHARRKLQIVSDDERIFIIGIANQDDVAAIKSGLGSM